MKSVEEEKEEKYNCLLSMLEVLLESTEEEDVVEVEDGGRQRRIHL